MKKYGLIGILIAGLSLGSLAAAQEVSQGEPQARTRLRERIGDLYILRLTRALELTEGQTAKIYPLLVRAEKDKAGLQRQLGLDMRELRAELARPRAGEGRLLELVAGIRTRRQAIRELDDEVEAVLDGLLTPLQKARYLVFTVEFLRSVGENLDRARGLRAPDKRNP
jgi:Spy/CpxP family protein refolding chaperone